MAPTLRGLQASARKNNKRFCAAMRASHPFHQAASPVDVGVDAIWRVDVARTLRAVEACGKFLIQE
jgi:hypothetical protein